MGIGNNKKLSKIAAILCSAVILAIILSFSAAGKNIISSALEKLGLPVFSESKKQIVNTQEIDPVQNELPHAISQNTEEAKEDNTEDSGDEINQENYSDPADKVEDIPARSADLIIGVMADSQAEAKNYWLISEFAKKMEQVEKPDFVIEAGDFIENRDENGEGKQPREEGLSDFRIADSCLYDNLGDIPSYHVIGNHEVLSLFKKDWKNLTGRNSYYSFTTGNYQIIALDAMYWPDSDKDVELNNEKPGAYVGYIPPKERDWLKSKLKEHRQNIIFVHHPLYNVLNSAEIEELLEKYNDHVILIANGHKNRARKLTFAGIDYIDLPSLEHQKQYAIIEVNGNKATVEFVNLQ